MKMTKFMTVHKATLDVSSREGLQLFKDSHAFEKAPSASDLTEYVRDSLVLNSYEIKDFRDVVVTVEVRRIDVDMEFSGEFNA